MTDFSQQINSFGKYGTFGYVFDEAGNVILNPSSSVFQQNYIALGLSTYSYDKSKILSFYDPTFVEFPIPQTTASVSNIPLDIQEKLDSITQQNADLQTRLNELIARNELNFTQADIQASKDIIIQLRIESGQGTSFADFEDDFPYLPIPLDQRPTL